jgi:protocatechuate 3,4-dioxygenase beta subunit
LNSCAVTKNIINNHEPKQFNPINNLLRSFGGLPSYDGEKIYIFGKVLDRNCVPISDAKVYLWQLSSDGKYPYEPLRRFVDKKIFNINSKSSFTGSGIARTNNQGEFYFITIYPKFSHDAKHSKTPYVNIRVKHPDIGEVQTHLALSKANLIPDNERISMASLEALLKNYRTYKMQIVLSGQSLKKY